MRFDLEEVGPQNAYNLLAATVMPRPIAWVTTVGSDGVVNAAPFSFFNVLGSSPPIVGVCPGDRADGNPKDTARNILDISLAPGLLVGMPTSGAHADHLAAAEGGRGPHASEWSVA